MSNNTIILYGNPPTNTATIRNSSVLPGHFLEFLNNGMKKNTKKTLAAGAMIRCIVKETFYSNDSGIDKEVKQDSTVYYAVLDSGMKCLARIKKNDANLSVGTLLMHNGDGTLTNSTGGTAVPIAVVLEDSAQVDSERLAKVMII